MSFLKKIGSFTLRNTTGSQSITGVGFQPLLLLFFSAFNWGWGDTVNAGWNLQFGAATSPTQRFSHSVKYIDNFTPSNIPGRNIFTDSLCINILGLLDLGGGNVFGVNRITADLSSIDSNGFTLGIIVTTGSQPPIEAFPTDTEVYYLALGGSDIAAKVGAFSLLNTDAGNNISVAGIPFTPKAVLVLGPEELNKTNEAPFNLGAAQSSSRRLHATLYGTDLGGVGKGISQARTTKFFKAVNESETVRNELDFVSMNNDGFAINVGTADTATQIGYIALGGNIIVDVDRFAGATAIGDQDVSSLISPEALIIFGDGKAAHTDLSTPLRPCFGFAIPGVSNVGLGAHIIQSANPSDAATRKDNTKSLISVDGNTATVTARGSITQKNSPNGFRVNWTEADAEARIFNFLAIRGADVVSTNWSGVFRYL